MTTIEDAMNGNPLGALVKVERWPVVNVHHDKLGLWADSPDVEGWSAAADDCDALMLLINEAREVVFRPMGWPR